MRSILANIIKIHVNMLKLYTGIDKTYCQRCVSSAGTLVSGDIRFVRIFGRVLKKGDVKGQWSRSRVNARLPLCINIS